MIGTAISHLTGRTGLWTAGALACLLMLGPVLPHPAMAQTDGTFDYTAATLNRAAQQGTVTAAGISWQCGGSRCTVSGPWPQPGVMACRALAQQVGPIKSYGHPGAGLNAAQLAQCNDGATAGSTAKVEGATIDVNSDKVPPLENRNFSVGPISGPKAETLPSTPLAVLESARPTGLLRTARHTWHCEGTRCTIPRQEGPLGGSSVDDCSRLAQAGGRVVWFTDGRAPFDAEKLARCNSPLVRNFEIFACSGADDLRDASHIEIGLYIRDRNFGEGNYRRILTSGIPRNSCQFHAIGGPAFRLSELITIYLRFQSYDSGLYQTDDNWDMTRFTIVANVTEPGGREAIVKIVDEQRNPVHRFASPGNWHIDINRR